MKIFDVRAYPANIEQQKKGLLGFAEVVIGDEEHKIKINKIQIRQSLIKKEVYVTFPVYRKTRANKADVIINTIVAPCDGKTKRWLTDAVLAEWARVTRVEEAMKWL
jgi:hypothetical protein